MKEFDYKKALEILLKVVYECREKMVKFNISEQIEVQPEVKNLLSEISTILDDVTEEVDPSLANHVVRL